MYTVTSYDLDQYFMLFLLNRSSLISYLFRIVKMAIEITLAEIYGKN